LKNRSVSGYIAKNAFKVMADALFLRSSRSIDHKAIKRGLSFTLDRVHLNSIEAEILAEAILKEI